MKKKFNDFDKLMTYIKEKGLTLFVDCNYTFDKEKLIYELKFEEEKSLDSSKDISQGVFHS